MTEEQLNALIMVLIVFMIIAGFWLATLSYLVLRRKGKKEEVESEEEEKDEEEPEAEEKEKETTEES